MKQPKFRLFAYHFLFIFPLLLTSCYNELDCEVCERDSIENPSFQDAKIIVSLSDLRIECENGVDCFRRYNDKMEIVAHLNIEPDQSELDPAYLGYFLFPESNPKIPSAGCSEPPPPDCCSFAPNPIPGIDMLDRSASNVYLEYHSQNDQLVIPSNNKFIGISFLDITYEKALNHYIKPGCQSDFLITTSSGLPLSCSDNHGEIKWEKDIETPKFTAKVFQETEAIYFTLIKTANPSKVIRIAYKDPAYLEGKFIFN